MIKLISRFLLASGLYVALLLGIYWGITQWAATLKLSPEYRLISVVEALNQCDVERLNEAVNLEAVLQKILAEQLQSEQTSQMADGFMADATINQLMASQLNNTKTEIETNLAKCRFMGLNTKQMPFWVVPSLNVLLTTKTILGIISIRNSRFSTDKQSAWFTVIINAKALKNAEITVQLAQQPNPTTPKMVTNPWKIVGVHLNAAALTQVMPASGT
jgi:hypothetical protein